MKTHRLVIRLVPGQGESLESPEYQKALRDLEGFLSGKGVKISFMLDRLYAGVGESAALLSGAIVIIGAISPTVRACLVEWIKGCLGRKVRLEIGQDGRVKAEAHSVEQIDGLLRTARSHQKRSATHARMKKPATRTTKPKPKKG